MLLPFLSFFFILSAAASEVHPYFKNLFEDVSATEGSYVVLKCRADRGTNVKYLWKKKGNTTGLGPDLYLPDVTQEDSDTYECQAINSAGIATKFFLLSVTPGNSSSDDKPYFREKNETVVAAEGSDVNLTCIADRGTNLSYYWRSEISYYNGSSGSTLNFRNITLRHNATKHTCVAENSLGTATKTFLLIVGQEIEVRAKLESVTTDSANFSFMPQNRLYGSSVLDISILGDIKMLRRPPRFSTFNPWSYTVDELPAGGFYNISFTLRLPSGSIVTTAAIEVYLKPPKPLVWINSKISSRVNLGWEVQQPGLLTKNSIITYWVEYFKTTNRTTIHSATLSPDMPGEFEASVVLFPQRWAPNSLWIDLYPTGVPSYPQMYYAFFRVRAGTVAGLGPYSSIVVKPSHPNVPTG